MSTADNGGSQGVVTSDEAAITIDPSTNKAAPAPAQAAKVSSEPGENEKPSWLDARLEREKRQFLKELGIDSVDAGKAAIAAAKAAEEAKKTDAQKAADAHAALEKLSGENKRLTEGVSAFAKSLMDGLTDAQKAAVIDLAGDDASLQIKAVNSLRPTWQSGATVEPPAAKPVIPNTAVTKPAPKDEGNTASAADPKAIYEAWKDKNPFWAARFAEAHGFFQERS